MVFDPAVEDFDPVAVKGAGPGDRRWSRVGAEPDAHDCVVPVEASRGHVTWVLRHLTAEPAWNDLRTALARLAAYLDEHGSPIDWCGVGEKVVYGPRADVYLGVPLAPRFCRRIQQSNGTAAVLMSKHPKLLPLLRDGLPPGALLDGGSPGPRHSGTAPGSTSR